MNQQINSKITSLTLPNVKKTVTFPTPKQF